MAGYLTAQESFVTVVGVGKDDHEIVEILFDELVGSLASNLSRRRR